MPAKIFKQVIASCMLLTLISARCAANGHPSGEPNPEPERQSTVLTAGPAARAAPIITPQPTGTQFPEPTKTPAPTRTATATITTTPLFVFDLYGYDPDLFQPLDVSHNPPLIARSDEEIRLVFDFANLISMSYSVPLLPQGLLYNFYGDLAFDQNGQLVVFDWSGEVVEGSFVPVPQGYRLLPGGELDVSAPVYVKSPSKITRDLKVLDYSDSRLVAPFNSNGVPNAREAQRGKQTWEFPKRFVEGLDPYVAHYADVKEGLAFEVHSVSPLGVITEFEKTPQGYILTFLIGDRIRAVWIDPAGQVLKDVTLPNGGHSEINFNGQVAVAQDGSLYTLSSTERGIEVHFVAAP